LINVAQNVLVSGADAKRYGNAHPNLVPYQLFEAADRQLVVAVGSDAQWRACSQALGLSDLAVDPNLATNAGRLADRARIVARIQERLRVQPAAHWMEVLSAAGVPSGVVNTVKEALSETDASPLYGVPPSVPGAIRLPPPTLGEHDQEIRERGWEAFD
jgi:crotonobetainyl-CoA:carnitine CoA-transferase CaiB-like acyl-CoA transferase